MVCLTERDGETWISRRTWPTRGCCTMGENLYKMLQILISHVNEYTYLGVRITKDGNHEPEINNRINRGRAAITKLNSILWDRDVTVM